MKSAFEHSEIIHQDNFYKPDELLGKVDGYADWDSPDCIFYDSFVKEIEDKKFYLSVHDKAILFVEGT